jgi:hypothetical protein
MRRFTVLLLALSLVSVGFEYVTDYGEVLEGTPLAALPEGHEANDGHAPAEHGASCDACHFGGVHLLALAVAPLTTLRATPPVISGWQEPAPTRVGLSRLDRPPIA